MMVLSGHFPRVSSPPLLPPGLWPGRTCLLGVLMASLPLESVYKRGREVYCLILWVTCAV